MWEKNISALISQHARPINNHFQTWSPSHWHVWAGHRSIIKNEKYCYVQFNFSYKNLTIFFIGEYFLGNKCSDALPKYVNMSQVWRWSLNCRSCPLICAESMRNGLVSIIMCIFVTYSVFTDAYQKFRPLCNFNSRWLYMPQF